MHTHFLETLAYDRMNEVSASASNASLAPLAVCLRRILHALAVRLDDRRFAITRPRASPTPAGPTAPT